MKNEPRILRALRSGASLEELCSSRDIRITRHPKYLNLVHLKYGKITVDFSDKITREARGLILDESNNWSVVAWPFDKFFNYGESHADSIDWNTAKVFEKLDGSLVYVYNYEDRWQVATSGTPDGSGAVNDSGITFHELFWFTIIEQWKVSTAPWWKPGMTYIYELCTPQNRIVVDHNESKVVFIGARNNNSGEEEDISKWTHLGWEPKARVFSLSSIDEILHAASQLEPLKQEGFVVVDADFNRVKIKSPAYVALHHHVGGRAPTPKTILTLMKLNELSEVTANFPHWREMITDVTLKYQQLVSHLEIFYERIKHLEVQKDFALEAVHSRYPAALFSLRAQKVASIHESLMNLPVDRLVELLDA